METVEKAILVGCILPQQTEKQVESSLNELSLLTEAAEAIPVLTVTQKRERQDRAYYIGKGKVEELKALLEELDADLLIFNNELSPSQLNNLESLLPCKVIDRTQLILDIFALRARSKEGQLQVELAQLKYLLPRIIGIGKSLSRLGGGVGTRGPGETKLEVDRRHIRRRIYDLEQELKKLSAHRQRYRERRRKNNVWQVALIGYTNAGKSTLLNSLTDAETMTANQLFATLDPTSRQLTLPSGRQVLLTDTVGFIQDLPTTLIAAFKSTLEELVEADLILHVIDSQDARYREQISVVEELVLELGAGHLPTVRVFNKRDLPPDPDLLISQADLYISAFDEQDLEQLKLRIEEELKKSMHFHELLIPSTDSSFLATCQQSGVVERMEYLEEEDAYFVQLYLPAYHSQTQMIEQYKYLE